MLLAALPGHAGLMDFSSGLFAYVQKRWGGDAPPRLNVLQRLTRDSKAQKTAGGADAAALKQVNGFFNQVSYFNDIVHWGVEDYWATPVEMLGSFGGDCEDYSIGKYLSLKEIGVPLERLRITYVRALKLGEAHMVLAYYATPDAEPLILDNLMNDIRPASQRTDLEPVYSFNDDDLWVPGGAVRKGSATSVRLWKGLLDKLAKEQQM
jgi:predicted transglutaminase-like cysteine proteinase